MNAEIPDIYAETPDVWGRRKLKKMIEEDPSLKGKAITYIFGKDGEIIILECREKANAPTE